MSKGNKISNLRSLISVCKCADESNKTLIVCTGEDFNNDNNRISFIHYDETCLKLHESLVSLDSDEVNVIHPNIGIIKYYHLVFNNELTEWLRNNARGYLKRNKHFNELCPSCGDILRSKPMIYSNTKPNEYDMSYTCPTCGCWGEYNRKNKNIEFHF